MRIRLLEKRIIAALLVAVLCVSCVGAQAQSRYGESTYLRAGMKSDAVRQLQEDLRALDYYTGNVTGHFGDLTETAVRKFQQKNGLTVDGVAGPKTLAKLSEKVNGTTSSSGTASGSYTGATGTLLTLNSTGDAVRALQENLTALGYYKSSITGHYGNLTKEAVRQFQKKNGLTADGVAGPRTQEKIASLLANNSGSSAGTGSTGTPSATPAPDTVLLNKGSSGEIVRQLQENLHALEFYDGVISGNYGNLTKEAVRQFQKKHGLTADGIAGPRTLAKIAEEIAKLNGTATNTPQTTPTPDASATPGNTTTPSTGTTLLDTTKTLRYGSRSEDVRKLQNALTTLGYFKGTSTAYYGTQTTSAVTAYQQAKGLGMDGIAGPKTLAAINADLQSAAKATGSTLASSTANGPID